MKDIFSKIPWQTMRNEQALIMNENPEDSSFITSAIGSKKDFIVAYTPTGKSMTIDVSTLISDKIKGYWFNPRSGKLSYIGDFDTEKPVEFIPWAKGRGSDFLLILTNQKID